MEALVEPIGEERESPVRGRLVASALPTLSPAMLLPRRPRARPPFPLADASSHFVYFARNGIYALARLWGLAGKEVLFPSYFHGVELEALLEAGVRPRFYPVDRRMQVDPDEVVRRIGNETAAVYLIHYLGFPGPVEELAAACEEKGVKLIEDCALALLSSAGERPLGSFGHASIFCLYKTLPTPNGGVLVLRQPTAIRLPEGERPNLVSTIAPMASSLLQRLELRTGHVGRAIRGSLRMVGSAMRWRSAGHVPTGTQSFDRSHVRLGMSPIGRVILESQDFAKIVERRRRSYFHLLGRLRSVSPPVFGELPPGVCPLFYPLQSERKSQMLAALRARGIDAVDFWRRGHPRVPWGMFPDSDHLRRTILEIPCHQDLEPPTVDRIADAVIEAMEEVG